MKNKLLSLFIICLFTLIGNAQLSTGGGSTCNCETVLNPTFELTEFNADTCSATLVANPGDSPCLDNYYLIYNWHRSNGTTVVVANNPSVTLEDFGNLGEVKVEVVANISQSGYELCRVVSDSEDFSDVICNFNNDGEITFSKKAYKYDYINMVTTNIRLPGAMDDGNNDINGLIYNGKKFEWRVTIENTYTRPVEYFYIDTFPGSGECGFTIESITRTVNGNMPESIPVNILTEQNVPLPQGITTISYIVRAPNDGNCSDCTQNNNAFTMEASFVDADLTLQSDTPSGGSGTRKSCVIVGVGCPMGLKDGYCLNPENMEQGDVLDVSMIGHTAFFNVKKMEGDLLYDNTQFNMPSMELIPSIQNSGFEVEMSAPDANGLIHFVIENPLNPFATFNISATNSYKPMSILLEFSEDLLDCTAVEVINLQVSNTINTTNVFLDPGIYCVDYDGYTDGEYESAWITPPGNECASINEPLTLTAFGPFETENPDTIYQWTKNGSTDIIGVERELNVTTSGVYKVYITDSDGCAREADIYIDACPVTCSCGDLNPEITLTVEGCSVIPEVSVQNCENVNFIQFEWEFSNGNTFNGQNPPPQYNWPNGGNLTAKLRVKYAIDFQTCIELDVETGFIPCRGPIKRELSLYPNPAKNNVTIAIEGEEVAGGTIEIVNIYGAKVLEAKVSKKEVELNVSKLKTGIYFVRHIDENKNITVKRLSISQ